MSLSAKPKKRAAAVKASARVVAIAPEPGCMSDGESQEDAIANLHDANRTMDRRSRKRRVGPCRSQSFTVAA